MRVVIAAELVVSEELVEKHINNIFAKLGLPPGDRDHRRAWTYCATWEPKDHGRAPADD
jgi:hypothetical protein